MKGETTHARLSALVLLHLASNRKNWGDCQNLSQSVRWQDRSGHKLKIYETPSASSTVT